MLIVKDEVSQIVTPDEGRTKQDYIAAQGPVETRGQLGFLSINPFMISKSRSNSTANRSLKFFVSLTPSCMTNFVVDTPRLCADWPVRKLLLKED